MENGLEESSSPSSNVLGRVVPESTDDLSDL